MFVIMLLLYAALAFLDLSMTSNKEGKAELIIYFSLMTLSCAIGIATAYIGDMPSPAIPIKQIVFAIMGK